MDVLSQLEGFREVEKHDARERVQKKKTVHVTMCRVVDLSTHKSV